MHSVFPVRSWPIGVSRGRRTLAPALAAAVCALLAGGLPGYAADCSQTSVSKTPLSDLGTGTYGGYPGGLYPGGVNVRPPAHDALLDRVGRVVLLDELGQPDADDGLFVLLSVGMSSTLEEFGHFEQKVILDPKKNSKLVTVNGAEGGQDALDIADPNAPYWSGVDTKLAAEGIDPLQVQIVWLKEARRNPTESFPQDAEILRDHLRTIVRIIKDRYPNTKIVYLASRIYAGYASITLNPEPYAYQSAFSARWLIEEQLAGDPALNFDPARGPVESPWLSWGPYMWADGTLPRSDGLVWNCADFVQDGTHPLLAGRNKVADLLIDFFQNDPTAKPWYVDCDTSDPGTFAAPPTVQNVTVTDLPAGVRLSWDDLGPSVGDSVVYDVTTGSMAHLFADQGFARASCLASGVAVPQLDDASTAPTGSDGSWYLVRGRNGCGTGSWGDDAPERASIDAAVACP